MLYAHLCIKLCTLCCIILQSCSNQMHTAPLHPMSFLCIYCRTTTVHLSYLTSSSFHKHAPYPVSYIFIIIVIQTFLTVLRNVFSPNPCHMFYLSTKCYISQCDYHHTHDIPILIFMITHLIVLSYAPSFMTDRYIR